MSTPPQHDVVDTPLRRPAAKDKGKLQDKLKDKEKALEMLKKWFPYPVVDGKQQKKYAVVDGKEIKPPHSLRQIEQATGVASSTLQRWYRDKIVEFPLASEPASSVEVNELQTPTTTKYTSYMTKGEEAAFYQKMKVPRDRVRPLMYMIVTVVVRLLLVYTWSLWTSSSLLFFLTFSFVTVQAQSSKG